MKQPISQKNHLFQKIFTPRAPDEVNPPLSETPSSPNGSTTTSTSSSFNYTTIRTTCHNISSPKPQHLAERHCHHHRRSNSQGWPPSELDTLIVLLNAHRCIIILFSFRIIYSDVYFRDACIELKGDRCAATFVSEPFPKRTCTEILWLILFFLSVLI